MKTYIDIADTVGKTIASSFLARYCLTLVFTDGTYCRINCEEDYDDWNMLCAPFEEIKDERGLREAERAGVLCDGEKTELMKRLEEMREQALRQKEEHDRRTYEVLKARFHKPV